MQPIYEIIFKLIIALPFSFWFYRDSRGRDYFYLIWTFTPLLLLIFELSVFLILLFPLGAIYFILRPKGALQNCPRCGRRVHDILFLCPYCKRTTKHECLQCHEPVPWDAEQCPFCQSRAITKDTE